MTVRELIRELLKYDMDMRVVTPGFDENGLDDVGTVEVVRVEFRDHLKEGHHGRHKEVMSDGDDDPVYLGAVLINF